MKILHRICLSDAINICLLVLIGLFAIHSFDELLAKFRFTTIADGLNAAFLEMRIAEKNYLLYGDKEALNSISTRIAETVPVLEKERENIEQVTGGSDYKYLVQLLAEYRSDVLALRDGHGADKRVRESGHSLRAFSEHLTAMERDKVAQIIERSKAVLRHSFWAVIFFAFVFTQWNARSIRRSLRQVEQLTRSIAKGEFSLIQEKPAADELGSIVQAISTMSDELNRREEEIVRSKRLASIGVLVAGVAHELNNPLNNISMIAQTFTELHDKLNSGQQLEFMAQIDEETERLRVTIKNLLDFSKPKEKEMEPRCLNEVAQKCIGLVQNMLTIGNIRTKLALAENLPQLCLDEHQIQQVLVNMLINAIQAMPPGGVLSVSTRLLPEQHMAEIEISDTGKGIPPELINHIFDPFFTTKDEGGTGLGLWVSYGIIKNHGGEIHVKSTVNKGTTFTVTLPTDLERCQLCTAS
ncbi:sensor histidine kinase [Candidatus Electronema sp. JM]|uniref:sensor histidine kinase n=1 Tax=Candidatus Electronema sp. JM TaxID=3401571 RepID=UPI003AA94639